MTQLIKELLIFGLKQANACLFGGFLLTIMIISKFWYPLDGLHRYDFIFLAAVAFQIFLLLFKFETPREAVVIVIFHIVATIMELFKTADSIASWAYPEEFIFGLGNVPLFTGFMYSAVGSYIARVWRIFEFEFTFYPPKHLTIILVCCIYLNFFTHHFIPDGRWILLAATIFLFWRTTIFFKVKTKSRSMPLLFGWFLVSLFIWFAENIATFANIWIYPNQTENWQLVPLAKISSWYLLMLLSFVLLTIIKQIKFKISAEALKEHKT